jgi:hypothetical protein
MIRQFLSRLLDRPEPDFFIVTDRTGVALSDPLPRDEADRYAKHCAEHTEGVEVVRAGKGAK